MRVSVGDVFIVNLSGALGSEQGNTRPCIIIQNDVGNVFSTTTIVLPITSAVGKKSKVITHYYIEASEENGLSKDGLVLCEQIRTVDKQRLHKKIGKISEEDLEHIKKCVKNSIVL